MRKPQFVEKRVFYYAGVINTNFNKRIVPILEMINVDHDSVTIGVWLAKFKQFCVQNSKKSGQFFLL